MNLEQFGWNDFFAGQFAGQATAGVPGRVASANHGRFLVWTEAGELDVPVTGSLRQSSALWPAVGDWVVLREDGAVITQVLARKTKLSRKQPEREMREQVLAANIDVLFIVAGLDHEYNERRIERTMVMARESGARPVILLNKADLAGGPELNLDEVIERTRRIGPDIEVVALSALSMEGLDALPAHLSAGETAALIGSSGVGKSTILNRLLGTDRQKTIPVRAADSRGRHTTTSRELFLMPGGWLLMDLPGLREVQLWATEEPLNDSFDDIQQLSEHCRFRDCKHGAEPGCAVVAAGLDPARLANFLKMRGELAYLERKTDPRLARETKDKWKIIHKAMRKNPKNFD